MENSQQYVDGSDTTITINKPGRVLYCSDGVLEEPIEAEVVEKIEGPAQNDATPPPDPKTLTWGPWFSYYAWKSGTQVINAVDYAGESLASFFGITTPKYQIEINEHNRMQEEKRAMEEESAGWVRKGEGDIPLVLNEPIRDVNKTDA